MHDAKRIRALSEWGVDGIVTDWLIVSVLLEPLPPSQSFHEPVRAGLHGRGGDAPGPLCVGLCGAEHVPPERFVRGTMNHLRLELRGLLDHPGPELRDQTDERR